MTANNMSIKRIQINNLLDTFYLQPIEQGYNHGVRVWYVPCTEHERGRHKYTLTSGIPCVDWWSTIDLAHTALFTEQGIRADNYNGYPYGGE